jgi:hypothetical protein
MNLELRVALRVVTALDTRVDVEDVGMNGLVVEQQRCDVVEDRAAFDAAVGKICGITGILRESADSPEREMLMMALGYVVDVRVQSREFLAAVGAFELRSGDPSSFQMVQERHERLVSRMIRLAVVALEGHVHPSGDGERSKP